MIRIVVSAVLLLAFSVPVSAEPIIFTDRAAFDSALADHDLFPLQSIDLNRTPPDPGVTLEFNGVGLTWTFDEIVQFRTDINKPTFVAPASIIDDASFLVPVLAFGLDITPLSGPCTSQPCVPPPPFSHVRFLDTSHTITSPTFFGAVFDEPTIPLHWLGISTFGVNPATGQGQATATGVGPLLQVQTVPEPTSATLFLVGLGAAAVRRVVRPRSRHERSHKLRES